MIEKVFREKVFANKVIEKVSLHNLVLEKVFGKVSPRNSLKVGML